MPLSPLGRVDAVPLIREVDEALIPLLRGLRPSDWSEPAVGDWNVRDVVAHLLDGAVRRLSLDRDGFQPPAPERDLSDYRELVAYLNDLNAVWVKAAKRLSPRVMTDLLEWICPQMSDYFESLDPRAEALFPVSWAVEDSSRVWMDLAREFTERWHHQQQIREAVGAPRLDQENLIRPLLETFVRALPRSYASVEAVKGAEVEIRIGDLPDLNWILRRDSDSWKLYVSGSDLEPSSMIEIPSEPAWRMFTKGISGEEAKTRSRTVGSRTLTDPFFETLAVMA